MDAGDDIFGVRVVDEAIDEPHRLREALLKLDYLSPDAIGGSGLAWCAGVDPAPAQALAALEKVWCAPLECVAATARYTIGGGEREGARKKRICHSDDGVSELTAVLYLSRPEHCAGGTRFFLHRPTERTHFDPDIHRGLDFFDPEQWSVNQDVEMRFNRLLTFPSSRFHALKRPLFGTCAEDGRLVLGFRLNRKRAAEQNACW